MQDQYIHDDTYHETVDNLEAIARSFDPAAPDDLRSQIIEALGDLGIWPEECFYERYERKVAA
ncbi:hypothetical protein GOA58_07035 [Sinorhizobium meliloti]|uniref:hypothetical protein n=1 Tax=Sinorhizobium TaxID=28105 RepID=UPI0012980F47|nr:hypothetical protein [Sinorhizobium medicae]MDW9447444.1 hypothetical protein [Sinorhizobium meliloti]MDW9660333.1 hypothetical protein [Sinorhizobium meliloti]MDX0049902.1 hypothetical protein [Sinorhizobium meliloti]MQV98348.1 hypothetical protein [Sinorhizobium medicae]